MGRSPKNFRERTRSALSRWKVVGNTLDVDYPPPPPPPLDPHIAIRSPSPILALRALLIGLERKCLRLRQVTTLLWLKYPRVEMLASWVLPSANMVTILIGTLSSLVSLTVWCSSIRRPLSAAIGPGTWPLARPTRRCYRLPGRLLG